MALQGVRVLELAGLAPAPMCTMILADFGASVTRVDRIGGEPDVTGRGKRSIALNLKDPEGVRIVKNLCRSSDVLIEPFRPGVMEKLGLGPDEMIQDNPQLIYARLTGWGQTGPYRKMAGHDINYLGLSGVLASLGRKNENPLAPTNLLADFAGGSFTCALGIMAALLERNTSGKGQVVDSAMVEGAAYVGSWLHASKAMSGLWGQPRGCNILDSGAHFYETYRTKDDKFMAVGAIEPQFYETMLDKLNITQEELPHFGEFDKLKTKLASIFLEKTRDEWCEIFDGTDACVTPVLDQSEAALHPQNIARSAFLASSLPRPAPLLSRTPAIPSKADDLLKPGTHSLNILEEMGISAERIEQLRERGVVGEVKERAKL